ncbi:unnamed protein product, partial [Effrenium voratum]
MSAGVFRVGPTGGAVRREQSKAWLNSPGVGDIQYPVPLFVHNTFIEARALGASLRGPDAVASKEMTVSGCACDFYPLDLWSRHHGEAMTCWGDGALESAGSFSSGDLLAGSAQAKEKDAETGRPASLEGFFHERQVFSCPGSRIDEDDTSAPRRMPYQPGEQLMRSAALDPLKDEVEPSPGAQASVPREEERSECSTADTGSFARNLCAAAPELPVLRLEAALSSVPLEKLENYSMGAAGHEVRQCRPCAFFHTKGCSSGRDCEFCHLCPKGEKQRRQKGDCFQDGLSVPEKKSTRSTRAGRAGKLNEEVETALLRPEKLLLRKEGPRPALGTRTPMGQELETLLEEAKTCAEQRLFGLLQSLAGGGVPGLRSWLQGLGLGSRAWAALVWAEQQGACDLDEVLENSEDLAQALQLSGEELAAFLSQNATSHAESQPRGLLGAEHEELMRFLLREGRSNAAVEAFTNFDARLSAAGTGLSREKIEGLEALLASEVQ